MEDLDLQNDNSSLSLWDAPTAGMLILQVHDCQWITPRQFALDADQVRDVIAYCTEWLRQ